MMTPRYPIYAGHRQFANLFPRHPDHDTTANLRSGRTQAFVTWADVTGMAMGGDDPYRRHRSAHRALCQCVNAKLTVPPG